MRWEIKHKSGRVLFVSDSKVTADNREKMGWIVEEVKVTSREQFEAWCINMGISITKSPGYDVYQNPRTKVIWNAWQSSRAAVEVELPEEVGIDCVFGYYADDIVSAIESAGLKVKK